MRPSTHTAFRPVLGVLAFKLNWLVLVLGQERWLEWAVLLLLAQLGLALPRGTPRALRQLAETLVFAACGIAADSALQYAGVLQFPGDVLPAWLALLWCAFAVLLAQLRAPIRHARAGLLVPLGAAAGALGYGAGAALCAVAFGIAPWLALGVIAALWCGALPLARLLFVLADTPAPAARLAVVLVPALVVSLHAPVRASAADAEWTLLGEGRYSLFMLPLYTARLEVAAEPFVFPGDTPFRLTLRYHRAAAPERVLEATLNEWQAQGIEPPAHWIAMLRAALPPLVPDDELTLQVARDYGAVLLHNGRAVSTFADPAFTRAFAGIWLGANTSAPQLRRKLLGEKS